jgi:hypothetical protein
VPLSDVISPLDASTRDHRRLLLIVSVLTVVILAGGAMPTEVQQLGLKFDQPARRLTMSVALLGIHAYLLLAFFYSSRADKRRWEFEYERFSHGVLASLNEYCDSDEGMTQLTRSEIGRRRGSAFRRIRDALPDLKVMLRWKTYFDVSYHFAQVPASMEDWRIRRAYDRAILRTSKVFSTRSGAPTSAGEAAARLVYVHTVLLRVASTVGIKPAVDRAGNAGVTETSVRLEAIVTEMKLRSYAASDLLQVNSVPILAEFAAVAEQMSAWPRSEFATDADNGELQRARGELDMLRVHFSLPDCPLLAIGPELEAVARANYSISRLDSYFEKVRREVRSSIGRFKAKAAVELDLPLVIGALSFIVGVACATRG